MKVFNVPIMTGLFLCVLLMITSESLYCASLGDCLNTAIKTNIGAEEEGNISDENPQDWWKVTVADLGRLTVTFRGDIETSLSYTTLSLYDPSGSSSLNSTNISGITTESVSYDVGPGTYYVRINQRRGDVFSYDLTTRFSAVEYEDDPEPNDNLSQASGLPIGVEVTGNIGFFADHKNDGNYYTDKQDWYKITVPELGELTVSFRGSIETSLSYATLSLYDPSGGTRLDSTSINGITSETVSYGVGPGTYYARIEQRRGDVFSYDLKACFSAVEYEDDPEPNDHLNQASELPIGVELSGNIGYFADHKNDGNYYTDEQDWYKITLLGPGNLTVSFRGSIETSLSYATLSLYDPSGGTRLDSTSISGITSEAVSYEVEEPGTYYVRINQSRSDVFSYNLSCSFTGEAAGAYNVKATSGEGGTVSPRNIWVSQDEAQSFNVMPDKNFVIDAVTGCGGTLIGNTYTTVPVTEDCTVEASFLYTGPGYTISVSATPIKGGTVSGGGKYDHGENVTVNADAEEGYYFLRWAKAGKYVSTETLYTFKADSDIYLTAYFVEDVSYKKERIILDGSGQAVDISSNARIIGTGAKETINIAPDINVSFTAGDGDLVNLPYALEHYEITSVGNHIWFSDVDANKVITIIVNGTSIVGFADGSTAKLEMFFLPGEPPQVQLGGAAVGSVPLAYDQVEYSDDLIK